MLQKKYLPSIQAIIKKHVSPEARIFIFGSSLTPKRFHDIDIGIINGKLTEYELFKIKDELEESNIPYIVDVVNMDKVNAGFRNKILKQKVLWLT